MSPHRNRLRELVDWALQTRDDEITCDECAAKIDRYIDLKLADAPIPEEFRHIEEHIGGCGECREEFHATLQALRDEEA